MECDFSAGGAGRHPGEVAQRYTRQAVVLEICTDPRGGPARTGNTRILEVLGGPMPCNVSSKVGECQGARGRMMVSRG